MNADKKGVPSGSVFGGYRPALDGLRAVAVALVVAFHITTGKPSGGFLGVDVFFVLSGYLITTLLLRDTETAWWRALPAFWFHRARRLLPALLLLVGVTAALTARTSAVLEYRDRRSDTFSALFYYANWHFIHRSESYFAAFTAGTSPLLHTWSLAIEEQFYVVWPFVIFSVVALSRRRPTWLLVVVGALVVASSVWMAHLYDPVDPIRAYYGTDARAQSLLVGSFLAIVGRSSPALFRRRSGSAIALLGGVAALASALFVVFVNERSSFYYHGGAALFAVAVAVVLWSIEVAPDRLLGVVLSLPPIRWVGRISYGVYLWHWPIVVWLAPHWQSHYRLRQALEVVLTLSIAAASFHLLELPIRQGRVPLIGRSSSRLAFALVAGVAAAAFAAVSATTLRSDLAREVLDTSETPCPSGSPSAGDFFQGSSRQSADWCLRIAPPRSTSPVVATAGDSTSRALDPGMMRVAQARGWGYIEAGLDGCTVLRRAIQPHLDPVATRQARSCAAVYPRVIAQVTARYHPDVWIVADLTGNDPNDGTHPSRSRINALRHSIRDSIAELTADGAEVVVIRPEPVGEPPDCVLKHPPPSACSSQEFSINYPLTRFMDNTLRSILPSFGSKVSYVSIDDILCPTGRCPATIDGYIARFDSVHFTSQFSRKIVPTIILRAENAGTRFVRTHR